MSELSANLRNIDLLSQGILELELSAVGVSDRFIHTISESELSAVG